MERTRLDLSELGLTVDRFRNRLLQSTMGLFPEVRDGKFRSVVDLKSDVLGFSCTFDELLVTGLALNTNKVLVVAACLGERVLAWPRELLDVSLRLTALTLGQVRSVKL